MEMNTVAQRVTQWVKQYKYVVLIAIIGIVLLCLPTGGSGEEPEQTLPQIMQQEQSVATQLEQILSQLQGAGQVKVLLSIAQGERTEYQTDIQSDTADTSASIRQDTVIITNSDRNESAVIKQINPPVYLGAIVLCRGADDSTVKLAIVEAVSKATGLGADKICVLKMK